MSDESGDLRYLAAGGASAVLLPTLVFGLGAPLWLGLVGAGAAFAGVAVLMGPRSPFEGLDIAKIGQSRLAVVKAAMAEALPALDRLEEAGAAIRDADVSQRVNTIAQSGRAAIHELENAPETLSSVQRLLTYYIPRAAELAEGYAEMERRDVGADRRRAIADLLVKLQGAFAHYRDQLANQELGALDVDIKLVGEAIAEDIGQPVAAPRAKSGSGA